MANVDIRKHIRAMIWTAGPAFVIASVGFAILGLRERGAAGAQITSELASLDQIFWITPLNLIPLLVLVVLSIRKVPASMAIMTSALVAGALATVLQPQAVLQFVNEPELSTPLAHIKGIWSALATGFRMLQASLKWTACSPAAA